MLHAFTRKIAWLWTLLIVMMLLLSPTTTPEVYAAVNDTPVIFVNDPNVGLWTVGSGLAYWAYNCAGNEFPSGNDTAVVKRKPAGGGAEIQLDPAGESDAGYCLTYQKMLSLGDGLYYLQESTVNEAPAQHIMRMPLNAPFTPVVVKELAGNQFSSGASGAFVEAGGYLYWGGTSSNNIFRTLKNGSGPVETVTTTGVNPASINVVGTNIYFSDREGIWGNTMACDTLPCGNPTRYRQITFPNSVYGLIYQPINNSGFLSDGFRLYWVEQVGNSRSIRYTFCNGITICGDELVIDPGVQVQAVSDIENFYLAPENLGIGALLLANDNIFWTEVNLTPTGEIKRKPWNAPLDQAPDTIATAQPNLNAQLFAQNGLLYFTRFSSLNNPGGEGIYTLSLTASAIPRDFIMENLEVTQAIQNLANQAPLIAEKTTYVRAYAKQTLGPSTPSVEAQLIGLRNGNPLPGSPLKPVNGVRALTLGGSYDRARLNDGWYFLLPESWTTAGNVEFRAVVDPRHQHSDPTLANNTKSQTLAFQNQPPVCVMTVPVRTHNPIPSVYNPNVGLMVSNFDRRWPVPETWIYRDTEPVEELEICTWHYIPYPCYGPYELSDGWGITNGIPDRDKVIVSLWTRATLSFNPDACDDIGAPVQFMGMVHPDADNGGAAGYASTVSSQSWVQLPAHGPIASDWDAMEEGSTMAQELAHNHGRKHVNCNGPDDIDTGYPYPPCQISNVGPDQYYGFDIASRRPIRPNGAADFMSYANDTWVSDYTWRALMNSFATTNVAANSPLVVDQGNQFYVTGMVDQDQPRGTIDTLLVIPGATLPPSTYLMQQQMQQEMVGAAGVNHGDQPHVTYTLRLLNPQGVQIGTEITLTLAAMDAHASDGNNALFIGLFPETAEQVGTVQLVANTIGDAEHAIVAATTVVDSVSAGVNPPVVTIQQPAAGTLVEDSLTVQWTATDADPNDRLTFTVQYSFDGTNWATLAVNLPSTPDDNNTFTLNDLGSLHGSAPNAAKIRVLASDGINTTIAPSQGFTLANQPPLPVISAPASGETLIGGESVVVQGTATDPEDGGLPADKLEWQMDSTPIGTGNALAVEGLASGTHTVALSATDANSQTETATLSFNLAPLGIPLTGEPVFDGYCNDANYTDSINLPLHPYGDDTQANVLIMRSDEYLWACFANLKTGAVVPGAYAGLRVDVDNSREANAQTSDLGFFVSENGSVFTQSGNGNGVFVPPGPGGLEAQIVVSGTLWTAELRIEKAKVGGWDHLIGLAVGHHSVAAEDDDYVWPFAAQMGKPNTWSAAALGTQPIITLLQPASAPVLAASFPMTVEGSGLVSGTVVLWNGEVIATTWLDDEHLRIQVPSAKLNAAGNVPITTRSPGSIVSNPLQFVIEAAAPIITSLSPSDAPSESDALLLTINGSNFAPNAKVLWDGQELTPQSVNPNGTQLTVQISEALLVNGQVIGVGVSNPTPSVQNSALEEFTIFDPTEIFIPNITKE